MRIELIALSMLILGELPLRIKNELSDMTSHLPYHLRFETLFPPPTKDHDRLFLSLYNYQKRLDSQPISKIPLEIGRIEMYGYSIDR